MEKIKFKLPYQTIEFNLGQKENKVGSDLEVPPTKKESEKETQHEESNMHRVCRPCQITLMPLTFGLFS